MIIASVISALLLLVPAVSYASAGITYHGRLLKPDGTPVISSVQFRLQIRTPGAQNCLMYEEYQSKDLSATNGVFAIAINDGSAYQPNTEPFTLDRVFQNRGVFTFGAGKCTGANTYTPDSTDGRKLVVEFNDGSGWEAVPAQTINYVPMALESMTVGGFNASSLLRVTDAGGTPAATTPLTQTQYGVLLGLIDGTAPLQAGQIPNSFVTDAMVNSVAGSKVTGNISGLAKGFTDPLAGDVTGTQSTTKVVALQGRAVDTALPSNGQVLKWSDANMRWEPANDATGVSGGGVASLNGSTESSQSFTTGTTGNAPNWSSNTATGVHMLNIPLASSGATVTAGLLSNSEYAALSSKLSAISNSASLANAKVWIGDGSGKAQEQTLSGDLGVVANGVATVTGLRGKNVNATAPTTAGQVLRYDGMEYRAAFLGLADIRSTSVPGNAMFAASSCTAAQTLFWSSLTDQFGCQSISITESNISGNIAASKISGNLPSSQVSGTFPVGQITGLGTMATEAKTNYVAKAGDTMTGALNLPANGLAIGTSQFVMDSGMIGVNADPWTSFSVAGEISAATENDWSTISNYVLSSTPNHSPMFIGYRVRDDWDGFPLSGDSMADFQGRSNAPGWSGMGLVASENHSATNGGTEIRFHVMPNGSGQSPAEVMRLRNNGNVGIGTTTPSQKLHVAGTPRIEDGTQGAGKVLTSDANGVASWQSSSGGGSAILTFTNAYVPGNGLRYYPMNGGNTTISSTENDVAYPLPRAGTLKNFFVRTTANAQPAGGTLVLTVRKNNAATALTVTVPAGGAVNTNFSNTSATVSVSAGDVISISAANSAGGNSPVLLMSLEFAN